MSRKTKKKNLGTLRQCASSSPQTSPIELVTAEAPAIPTIFRGQGGLRCTEDSSGTMWSRFRRQDRASIGSLSSNLIKSGLASPCELSAGQITHSPGTAAGVHARRASSGSRRQSNQSPRQGLFSEGVHSFWSLRSGLHPSRTMLDLACVVASILTLAVCLVALSAVLHWDEVDKNLVLVTGDFGSYRGTVSVVAGVTMGVFLGVPYAKPSTARFAPPVAWHGSVHDYDATARAPACAQSAPTTDGINASMSEDCLRLNIWAPSCGHRLCPGNKTVVFFIHGGFFQSGSNNDPDHDGQILAAAGDVLVVVPNWRLGVLGFLNVAVPDAPVNAGLLDQAEALKWTMRHAAAFGGNASDVVVVGHGSGASAVGYHLFAGDFMQAGIRKFVFMSESPYTRYPVYDRGLDQKRAILARLVCERAAGTTSWLACLRDLPVAALLKEPPGALRGLPTFFPVLPVMWRPSSWEMLKVSGLSVLMGFSNDEGSALLKTFGNYFRLRERDLREAMRSLLALLGFLEEDANEILQIYPEGASEGRWAADLVSDLLVICPVRFFAERLHALGNRVHRYVLHRADPKNDSGTSRGYAVRLLFGVTVAHSTVPEEQTLGHRMIAVMSRFFKTGELDVENDTVTGEEVRLGLSPASKKFSQWVPNLRSEECEKLRRYFPISGEHHRLNQR